MSTWTWSNNGSGVPIGYVNGSIEYKAGDIGKSLTLCQRCTHLKHGPVTVTISEDITISGEYNYCTASRDSQMQIVNGAVVKCSKFQEANHEG